MPKYNVTVERTTTHTAVVEVTAKDEDEASEKALQMLENPRSTLRPEWDLEDETYDCRDVEEA